MVDYDSRVIQKFADKLYSQANSIVALWTVLGLIVGGIGGGVANRSGQDSSLGIGGAIFLGVLGYLLGQARAFALRLQAQTALCQAKIERNTRPHRSGAAGGLPPTPPR